MEAGRPLPVASGPHFASRGCAARDTSDAAAAPSAAARWRTSDRQPTVVCNDDGRALPYSLVIRYAPFRGAKSKEQKRARSDASDGFNAAWATRAAAEAAKSDFKAWVDGGMNPNQRACAAASAMARGAAAASSSGPQTAPAIAAVSG